MRWIAIAVTGVVTVVIPAGAAPRPKNVPDPPLYYATAVGSEWVYSYTAGIDTSQVKRTLVQAEPTEGGLLLSIDREWDGKTTADSRVLVGADGLRALPVNKEEKDGVQPLWLLKRPIIFGQKWELPQTGWNEPAVTYIVTGIETVEVPAGIFEAVRVDIEWSKGGFRQSRLSKWYARDVGLVKWTNHSEFSEVLISFKPGKGGVAAAGARAR